MAEAGTQDPVTDPLHQTAAIAGSPVHQATMRCQTRSNHPTIPSCKGRKLSVTIVVPSGHFPVPLTSSFAICTFAETLSPIIGALNVVLISTFLQTPVPLGYEVAIPGRSEQHPLSVNPIALPCAFGLHVFSSVNAHCKPYVASPVFPSTNDEIFDDIIPFSSGSASPTMYAS